MATWDDVRRLALSLPETDEVEGQGLAQWRVKAKSFAWERPLRRADFAALGVAAPTGDILGVWVPDLGAKEALIAEDPGVYFTTPHFDGYAAVLARLDEIDVPELEELLVEGWLTKAPKRLAKQFLDETGGR